MGENYIYLNGVRIAALGHNGYANFYLTDQVDSVKLVTDNDGTAITRFEYLPYGESWFTEGKQKTAPKYNSQELDKETGYYYYNARHYDPEIARFVTADSIIAGVYDTQGWNRYSYVKGNPIRYSDPTGHNPKGDGHEGGYEGGLSDKEKKQRKQRDRDEKPKKKGLWDTIKAGYKKVADWVNQPAVDAYNRRTGSNYKNYSEFKAQMREQLGLGKDTTNFVQRVLSSASSSGCWASGVLGPYRGVQPGLFNNDPVIYDETDYMTLPGTVRSMTSGDIGDISKALAEGLPAHGSVRVRVYGIKKTKSPRSWTADVYSEKQKGYGWNKMSEELACEKNASRQAIDYFRDNDNLN